MTKEFDARNENKSRSVCASMAEAADTDKRVLSEKERRILDMWPRFGDTGECAWFGDAVAAGVANITVEAIEFTAQGAYVKDGQDGDWSTSVPAEGRLKRPATNVLDADGVPIREGDMVWHEDGTMLMVDGFGGVEDGETIVNVHIIRGATPWREVRSLSLTHTRPDSWERLEEEADKDVVDYWGCAGRSCYACPAMIDGQTPSDRYGCMSCKIAERLDIIRRAKKLAGVE